MTIHETAWIAPGAHVSGDVTIGPGCGPPALTEAGIYPRQGGAHAPPSPPSCTGRRSVCPPTDAAFSDNWHPWGVPGNLERGN